MSEEDINFLISIQGLEQPEFDNACLERENKKLENEIERLTKQNKSLNEMYELTKKEYIRLNNIINELEKYFEQEGFWHSLDKIKELKGVDKE